MTLMVSHFTAADYRETPWKNGGGSTTELAIHPAGFSVEQPFVWYLSLVKRTSSGPFAKFPGYDRNIVQLSGKTMTLMHAKHGEHKLSPLVPYAFKGEWETHRRLIGSAEDFNLMVRSERLTSTLERVDLKDRKPLSKRLSRTTLIWVYQGTIEWECGGEKKILKERETLAVDSSEKTEYILKSKRAIIFLASIEETAKP